MGKKPDEIEREIAAQRARIGSNLSDLRSRAKHDARSMQDAARQDIERAEQAAHVDTFVRERPLTAVAAAVGAGVVVGAATGRRGTRRKRTRAPSENGARHNGMSAGSNERPLSGGIGSQLIGSVTASLSTALADELKEVIDDLRRHPQQRDDTNAPRTAPMF